MSAGPSETEHTSYEAYSQAIPKTGAPIMMQLPSMMTRRLKTIRSHDLIAGLGTIDFMMAYDDLVYPSLSWADNSLAPEMYHIYVIYAIVSGLAFGPNEDVYVSQLIGPAGERAST